MSDNTSRKSLVPSGRTDLVLHGREGNKLIRRAASDALVPMQSLMNRPEVVLYRVGTREFHEEDFRQLQIWALELGMDGRVDELIVILDEKFKAYKNSFHWYFFLKGYGGLRNWYSDGRIKIFGLFSEEQKISYPKLPELTHYLFASKQLTEIDLSSAPTLTTLYCYNNQLTELNLSPVPALTGLWCHRNLLMELDLSSVPALRTLYCYYNQLTELNLSSLPALTELWCDGNRLAELDLSSTPALTMLRCCDNQLTELDLSSTPALTTLFCPGNQLTELDIRNCLYLESVIVDPWVVVQKRADQIVYSPG
jgi:hypothetical protein